MLDYQLSQWEEVLLELLTKKMTVLTAEQLTLFLPGLSIPSAGRLLNEVTTRHLLRKISAYARRPTELIRLAEWKPGEPPCDAGQIAYRSRRKWFGHPLRQVEVFAATRRGAALCGAPVARIKRHQIGHDLAVADLVLWLQEFRPEDAVRWRGESQMAGMRNGEKLPDGFLVSGNHVTRVFEFCSGYQKNRIAAFCEDCYARRLPFEIWG